MKLHVGCGERFLPGWKHLDARKFPHVDYVTDKLDKLDMFADNSVEEIYACHVLEHMPRSRIRNASVDGGIVNRVSLKVDQGGVINESSVLKEWYRILKSGGILRLAVPDFEAVVEEYLSTKNLDKLQSFLHGGSKYEYDFHYQTYDFKRLSALLKGVGFREVERYDWREFLPPNYDDYSRSYLPHMDFEHGRLMSLNVLARK